jgi:hypothetical protein
MQKVSFQALNECFNVHGPDYIEITNNCEHFDCKFLSSFASKAGKISAKVQRETQTGFYGLTKEDRVKNGRKGGLIGGNSNKKNKTGFCGRNKQQMSEDGRKAGKIGGKVNGRLTYQNQIGIHALSKEETKKNATKGGKAISSQKWKCLVTGFVSTAGALGNYQKARGIETTKRIRIE